MKIGKAPRKRRPLVTVQRTEIAAKAVIVTVMVLFAVLNFVPEGQRGNGLDWTRILRLAQRL